MSLCSCVFRQDRIFFSFVRARTCMRLSANMIELHPFPYLRVSNALALLSAAAASALPVHVFRAAVVEFRVSFLQEPVVHVQSPPRTGQHHLRQEPAILLQAHVFQQHYLAEDELPYRVPRGHGQRLLLRAHALSLHFRRIDTGQPDLEQLRRVAGRCFRNNCDRVAVIHIDDAAAVHVGHEFRGVVDRRFFQLRVLDQQPEAKTLAQTGGGLLLMGSGRGFFRSAVGFSPRRRRWR
mmetsp:Transcript_14840/g.36991  ORF Transcript_14840/g.36991 Transcript_14840/m.36991 type:complete len:237 (+) Transcript_14840:151-861(+)